MGLIEVQEPSRERSRWYCERLEAGEILLVPPAAFSLADDDRAFLLHIRQASAAYHKNISYRPRADRVRGFARGSADAARLTAVLRAYSQRVARFVAELLAPYADRWQLDFASFRPVEEEGRQLSRRARNDLLHVDAFPTRPTHGHRILRVFTNLHPTKSRFWLTTETFDALAPRYATSAGLAEIAARARSPIRRTARRLVGLARAVGLPLRERSPYDQFMLRFHHYLKTNETFQASSPKHRWEFPANATWIVFTDMVPHAVLSGQYALEQTFIVPCDALVLPENAPLHILERLCGTPLTR